MKSGPATKRSDWNNAWFEVKYGSKAQRRRAKVVSRTAKRGERQAARKELSRNDPEEK